MNIEQLPYIIAIAKTGNLSAAASHLGISQPALSKYLIKLEKEVGMKLFTSYKKKLYPTNAGQVYLDAAYKIRDIQLNTINSIRAMHTQERKKLYIGVTPHRGVQLLAKTYPQFTKLFPLTELVLQEGYASQMREYVRADKVNFAMSTYDGYEEPGIQYQPLFDEELILSVPVFHPLANQACTDLENLAATDIMEFQDTPFVLMGPDTTIGKISARIFAEIDFTPTVIYTSNNILMVDEMIRAGAGVGLISRYYALPSKEVVYFSLRNPLFYTVCIISKTGHAYSKEERYLIYLQLKYNQENRQYGFRWDDTLRGIVDEFEYKWVK